MKRLVFHQSIKGRMADTESVFENRIVHFKVKYIPIAIQILIFECILGDKHYFYFAI
jgi:hypothetical protein